MKRLILVSTAALLFMLLSGVSKAQESKMMLGGGVLYATDISTVGVFAKGNYAINDKFEAAAAFNYFFPKDYGYNAKYHWMAIDLDGHYVFMNQNQTKLYGLAGLNILMVVLPGYEYKVYGKTFKTDGTTNTYTGFNIGIGGRLGLSSKVSGLGEVKYVVSNGSYLQLSVGILFAL